MKSKSNLKSFPKHKSDKEAEQFVRDVNLTEYDFKEFKRVNFEFDNKTARINMRVPELLLERIKKIALQKEIPYTRFIRQILEIVVEKEHKARTR